MTINLHYLSIRMNKYSYPDNVKTQSITSISQNIEKKILEYLELNKIPYDVSISTMTIICKLDTEFNCLNIAKYIDLHPDNILSVSSGLVGDNETNRTILPQKNILKSKKKKKKTTRTFFNQVTMNVYVSGKKKKPVNVKLFKNGSIQMTGCKQIEHAIEVLIKLLSVLQTVKAVVDYDQKKIVEQPFVPNPSILTLENIKNFKIAMVNSNFKVEFKIDRSKLYNLLISEKYICLFDPNSHASVDIKYEYADKPISIFVFQKGSIIITGAKNCDQILAAYNFINTYLLKNYNYIVENEVFTYENVEHFLKMI